MIVSPATLAERRAGYGEPAKRVKGAKSVELKM
jgi:hypothetical protein